MQTDSLVTHQYSSEDARNKNRTEYDSTADAYERWENESLLMQNLCYFSTIDQIKQEGIEGKTFLEVGCGPCPIGQRLALLGAEKIYGLDISQEMIQNARKQLDEKGIGSKFELICEDIFDDKFVLPEKVDMVICSYTISTFINSFEMLTKILSQCGKQLKKDGLIVITDFSWVEQPKDDWFFSMYTSTKSGLPPKEFEPFQFHIVTAPDAEYDIFNIPAETMYKAGTEAGYS